MYKDILFDLDGTLTDSSEGITKCAMLALNRYGINKYSLDDLRVFIGPPLNESFKKFNIDEKEIENAIKIFRKRYLTVGKFENKPFDKVEELLIKLKNKGCKLYIATSKPEETAIEILKHFKLDKYFTLIAGATFSHERESKDDVIKYLLKEAHIKDPIMVGDTLYDILGAKKLNIPSIGVSWGFGDIKDMEDNGALYIANSMEELYAFLTK